MIFYIFNIFCVKFVQLFFVYLLHINNRREEEMERG